MGELAPPANDDEYTNEDVYAIKLVNSVLNCHVVIVT
jgi:hypothetical protein